MLEIKNIAWLPADLRHEYMIPEFSPTSGEEVVNQTGENGDNLLSIQQPQPKQDIYIHPKYQQESDLLYKLLKKSSLRRFQLFCLNDFYLACDTKPTSRDITERAEILAKLYIKYHLKEEQEQIQREEEEKLGLLKEKLQRYITKQQLQNELEGKVESSQETEKLDAQGINKSFTQKSEGQSPLESSPRDFLDSISNLDQQQREQLLLQQQEYIQQQIKY